jgi:membrane protein implicated in regulation of membrane protease activity
MWSSTFGSGYWFGLTALLFAVEVFRPGKFMMWLGFAPMLVGIIASVAPWPWPAEVAALIVFAIAAVPGWRLYERKAASPAA